MIAVHADIDYSELSPELDKIRHNRYYNVAIQEMAGFGITQLKALTPGSGKMRDSWKIEYERDVEGKIRKAVLYSDYEPSEVVGWMEDGTKPHQIMPKTPEDWLVFYWEVLGRVVFAKKVDHPGTKAYKMVEVTHMLLNANINTFTTSFEQNIQKGLNN